MVTPLVEFFQARQFKFRPVYSFVMLLGISVCALAAVWQYQKAQFFTQPKAQVLHIEGEYLNQHTHFLDNQTHNGKVGYAAITPFLNDGTLYLVNRGFIAYGNREVLPKVNDVTGKVTLLGRLHVNQKPLLLNTTLQDPIKNRIQFIDHQYFSSLINSQAKHSLNSEIFVLKEGPGLLTKANEKVPYLSHHKHQAYALQWMLLGVFGLAIWLVASLQKIDPENNKNEDAIA